MTREEARKELSVEYLGDSERMIEAKKMAVKALEQEPTLSIDDVMSVFEDFMCGEVDEEGTETFLEMLKYKAEIEPQDIDYKAQYERLSQKAEIVISQLRADRDRLIRPKGHWICDGKGRSFADYHCSECGLKLALCGQDIKQRQDSGYSLFCGGCGADMREVEE